MRISVIIPVYNSERYLEKLFRTLEKNSGDEIEYVLINDGSVDGSHDLCKLFKETHKNVVYRYQDNRGVSAARNLGLEIASGQYIMFVDSDDSVKEGYFDSFLDLNENVDFVISGYSVVEAECILNRYVCKEFEGSTKSFLEQIESYTDPPYLYSPWAKAFKKSIIDDNNLRFDERISYGEDVLFVLEFLKRTNYVKCIVGDGYFYSVDNTNSLARKFNKEKFDSDMLGTECLYNLLEYHNISFSNELCEKKTKQNFVLFCHSMLNSDMKYNEARAMFYEIARNYNLTECKWFDGKKSFWLIGIILKYKFFYPFVYLLKK